MAKNSQLTTALFVLAVLAVAFPLIPLFDHLGRPELWRPTFVAVVALAVTIKVCRELRSRPWFWFTIIVIAACHVPLIMLTPWPTRWIPAPVFFLFATVDCAAILAIISLIEKVTKKTSGAT